jgi:hypothetical protein
VRRGSARSELASGGVVEWHLLEFFEDRGGGYAELRGGLALPAFLVDDQMKDVALTCAQLAVVEP